MGVLHMEKLYIIVLDDECEDSSKIIKVIFNGIEKEFKITPYMEDFANSIVDDLYDYLKISDDKGIIMIDGSLLNGYELVNQIYNSMLEEVEYFKSKGFSKKHIIEQIIYDEDWVQEIYNKYYNLIDGLEMSLPKGVFYSICCALIVKHYS